MVFYLLVILYISTTPVISVDQAIENIASQGNQVVAVEQSSTSSVCVSSTSGVTLAKKPVNLPSWGKLTVDMRHIGSGHMPGGFRNNKGNKTVFGA
ncbi:MAG: hypothetical protein IJZ85_10940 [Lachnospiraceae bacterium]|nr:hypothetical protein [Lachnospiraceae bacterium]